MVVYVYPIDTNLNPMARTPDPDTRTTKAHSEAVVVPTNPTAGGAGSDWSDLLNRTATIFNEWIDSHIEVLLINDAGATSDITTPWSELSHALNLNPRPGFNATNVSSAASACVAAQVADLGLDRSLCSRATACLATTACRASWGALLMRSDR